MYEELLNTVTIIINSYNIDLYASAHSIQRSIKMRSSNRQHCTQLWHVQVYSVRVSWSWSVSPRQFNNRSCHAGLLISTAVVCQAGDGDDDVDDGDDETEPEERAVDDLGQQLPLVDD